MSRKCNAKKKVQGNISITKLKAIKIPSTSYFPKQGTCRINSIIGEHTSFNKSTFLKTQLPVPNHREFRGRKPCQLWGSVSVLNWDSTTLAKMLLLFKEISVSWFYLLSSYQKALLVNDFKFWLHLYR